MSDIFREVEEDLRQDRYEKIWNDWKWVIIGGVVIVVGGTASFQLWQSYQNSQRLHHAEEYIAASELDRSERQDEAITAFTDLAQSGSAGYQALAKFRKAGILGDQGKLDEAIALFDEIAADPSVDDSFQRLAQTKAAVLMAESYPYEDVKDRLVPLAEAVTPWRFTALEILGYAAFKHDDQARAIQSFQRLVEDPETPISIRTRATEMLVVLGAPKATETAPAIVIDGAADETSETDNETGTETGVSE